MLLTSTDYAGLITQAEQLRFGEIYVVHDFLTFKPWVAPQGKNAQKKEQ